MAILLKLPVLEERKFQKRKDGNPQVWRAIYIYVLRTLSVSVAHDRGWKLVEVARVSKRQIFQ
jgi:hypothetical protein